MADPDLQTITLSRALQRWLMVAAGLSLAASAEPWALWPLALVSYALCALALAHTRARTAFALGWIYGSVTTAAAMHWIVGTVLRFTPLPWPVAALAWLLVSAASGLTHGVAFALSRSVPAQHRLAPLTLFAGIIVAERWMPTLFPWQLGAPLINAPWIAQSADWLGASAVGAIVFATLVSTVIRIRENGLKSPIATLVISAPLWLLVGYGAIRSSVIRSDMARAQRQPMLLVQPAIPPVLRWDPGAREQILSHLQSLVATHWQTPDAWVVYSEASYPFVLPHEPQQDGARGPQLVDPSFRVPVLLGALTTDASERRYNSVFLRQPDGWMVGPVSKRKLVPFGEYIPLVGSWSVVKRILPRVKGLSPGQAPEMLSYGNRRLGILNCFEDTVSEAAFEISHADLLVNMTNDAWFGAGAEPEQHLMLARWRSIETRREMVRAVNTGITSHINALGEVEARVEPATPNVLFVRPRVLSRAPIARWMAPVIAYGSALFLALCQFAQWRSRRSATGRS